LARNDRWLHVEPIARVARFPLVTARLLRPALFPRADKPRKETAMSEPDTTTEATHTLGPWRVFDLFTGLEIVTDRKTAHETESIVQFKGQRNAKANARLMAAAPTLLQALIDAHEEATDIMHYEGGLPVTAPEGWEIERAYMAPCGVLVDLDSAIAAAGGRTP